MSVDVSPGGTPDYFLHLRGMMSAAEKVYRERGLAPFGLAQIVLLAGLLTMVAGTIVQRRQGRRL